MVTGYRSHGTRTGTPLTDSANVTNADVTLGPVQADNVSVVITTPAGHQTVQREVTLLFSDRTFFPVGADQLADSPITVPVPTGIGAGGLVRITATNSDAGTYSVAQLSGLQPGTGNAPLSLPAPALATAPADGATGVDTSTDFVWSPLANGIHVLFLSGAANDPAYIIVSGGTRTRIPDLGAQGLGLPTGRPYDFGLLGVGPYANIDAFAAGPVPFEGFGFQTGSTSTFTTR
jgi:hypothetical protein